MANTIADNRHSALGGTSNFTLTNIDLLNQSLGGDIQKYGYGYAIIKNWGLPGDTVVEATRRHYGALPGETISDAGNRYWYANSLKTITNLVRDPTFKTITGFWQMNVGGSTIVADTTTSRPGALTVDSGRCSSSPTAQVMYMLAPSNSSVACIPCTPGQTFTMSAWVKTDAVGQTAKLAPFWRNVTLTGQVGSDTGPVNNLTQNVWVRISWTVPTNAGIVGSGYLEPAIGFSAIPVGNSVWVDDFMITADGTVWDYKDGGYPNWSWSGTANQSQSSGTTIT